MQCSPLKSHAPLIAGLEDSKGAQLGQFGCISLHSSMLGSFQALTAAQNWVRNVPMEQEGMIPFLQKEGQLVQHGRIRNGIS